MFRLSLFERPSARRERLICISQSLHIFRTSLKICPNSVSLLFRIFNKTRSMSVARARRLIKQDFLKVIIYIY